MASSLRWLPAVLLAAVVTSVETNTLHSAPMDAVVLPQNQRLRSAAGAEPALSGEQAQLQAASQRYSTEVADDEHLPLSLRKPEAPKGASLWSIGF